MIEAPAPVQLTVNGDELPPPANEEDIEKALAHAPFNEDWCLYLTLPNEDTLDVSLDHAGDPFDVGIEIGREYYMAEMERDLLKPVLVSFLAGDERWRDLADWRKPTPPDPKIVKASMNKQKWKLLLFLIPAIIAPLVIFDKGTWALALVFIGLPIAFTAVILLKLREVKRASTWTKGTARILRSEIRTETRTDSDTNSTRTLEHALVEYEYTVKFDKFRGKRISIGEVLPNTPAVQEALKKYPKGASAPVYYDPANPNDAVLDRDLPEKFGLIWVMVAITYAAGFAGAWWAVTSS